MLLFGEIDNDCSGEITEREWIRMFEDEELCSGLTKASGLCREDLEDVSAYFTLEQYPASTFKYKSFVDKMKFQSQVADKRSVAHLMSRLRTMENRMDQKFAQLELVCRRNGSEFCNPAASTSQAYDIPMGCTEEDTMKPSVMRPFTGRATINAKRQTTGNDPS